MGRALRIEGRSKALFRKAIQRAAKRHHHGVFLVTERCFQTGEQFGNRIHGTFGMPILAKLFLELHHTAVHADEQGFGIAHQQVNRRRIERVDVLLIILDVNAQPFSSS